MNGSRKVAKSLVGKLLNDRYLIREWINDGHFSDLFHCDDELRRIPVAAKVLKANSRAADISDFDLEQRILDHLASASNIVDLVDSGEYLWELTDPTSGEPVEIPMRFQVLEWADASLADLVADRDRLSWEDRLLLFRGVAKGLLQAHRGGVVHRDAKGENVLVFAASDSADTKLADFGRGRFLQEESRHGPDVYSQGRGDIRFAPPEALWAVTADDEGSWIGADLYAVGSVFFELGTGLGVSSLVFDDPLAIHRAMSKLSGPNRLNEFQAAMPAIRAEFESAFDLLAQQLPPSIRHEALRLVRVLCDPEPSQRRPQRLGSSPSHFSVAEWALRRVDILILSLSLAQRQAANLEEKRRRRQERRRRQRRTGQEGDNP